MQEPIKKFSWEVERSWCISTYEFDILDESDVYIVNILSL